MRYLFLLLVLILPLDALAVAGQDTRFDFSAGQPEITADATDECTNQAKARFDFTAGQPDIVYDATATCTAAAGGAKREEIIFIISD